VKRRAKTEAEARARVRELQEQHSAGLRLDKSPTLEQFLRAWLEEVIKRHRKPATYDSYAQLCRLYIYPNLGGIKLEALQSPHIQRLLNKLTDDGLQSARNVHALLRTALNQAMRWQYIGRNPAATGLVTAPAARKSETPPLTVDGARRLLKTIEGHRLELVYRLVLSLGLRKGEVLGLRWSDVDWERRSLRIEQQVQNDRAGKVRIVRPKTKESRRIVFLPDVLIAALRLHWQRQQDERATRDTEWREHGLIFPSNVGTPMSPRNIVRHFKSALAATDLATTTRFHDLRHSCASILLAQGVPLTEVSKLLGHSSIQITADLYGHVYEDVQRETASAMGKLLGS
jgi:integrase